MSVKDLVLLAIKVSILCTVLGFGLKTTPRDLLYLLRRPGLLLRSLLGVLVVMPICAVLLTHVIGMPPVVAIVMIALAISPVPPLLPGKETKSGGQASYGVALMAMLSALAIVTVPLSLEILGRMGERPLGASPAAVARVVVTAALLPLTAGIALRAMWPSAATRIAPVLSRVANVLLPLAVVLLLAGSWRALWDAAGGGAIVALGLFAGVGLLVGHVLGGPDPQQSIVLALSTSCRHPAIAFSIASANFPDRQFAGTILLYLLVNAVVGGVYVAWMRKRSAVIAAT